MPNSEPISPVSYTDVLGYKYPTVIAQCMGDGSDYDAIEWISGDPVPPKAELDADCLYYTQVRVWNGIKALRDWYQQNGVLVGSHWFNSDPMSRIQQIALVIFGANLPPVQWKTMDGSFVAMTPTLAQQIFTASAASDIAIFAVAEQHKARMLASQTPTTYDFSGGWPTTYTGSQLL